MPGIEPAPGLSLLIIIFYDAYRCTMDAKLPMEGSGIFCHDLPPPDGFGQRASRDSGASAKFPGITLIHVLE